MLRGANYTNSKNSNKNCSRFPEIKQEFRKCSFTSSIKNIYKENPTEINIKISIRLKYYKNI